MKHYTKEELECYRHHEMSVLGRINCSAHLKQCPECAKLLAELDEEDALVAELQESLLAFNQVPAPPAEAATALQRKSS